jgi:hypothetical protein
MTDYAIPSWKRGISSHVVFHDNAITDSSGNVYVTGKYKYNSTRALNNDVTIASTPADSFVFLKLDTNGYVIWAKTLNGTSQNIPTIYVSSTTVYVMAYINTDNASSHIQIMGVQYNGTQLFNKTIYINNLYNDSFSNTTNIVQLLGAYDTTNNKIYCSFLYKSESPIQIDSFTLPATGTYAYQTLFKLYGTDGQVQLGKVFQINTTIQTSSEFAIQSANSPGLIFNSLSLKNNNSLTVVGLYNSNSNYQLSPSITIDASHRLFICNIDSDLVVQAKYSSTLQISIGDSINIPPVYSDTHIFLSVNYVGLETTTFEQLSLPPINGGTSSNGLLLKVSNDLTSIVPIITDFITTDLKIINNSLYLNLSNAQINPMTLIVTYTFRLVKYNTSLQKIAEQQTAIDTYDFMNNGDINNSNFDPYKMVYANNAIYIIGGTLSTIKKYNLDATLIWTKEMPTYIRKIAGVAVPNNNLYILGNVNTSATQTLESRLQFASTNSVSESCIIKYEEPRITISIGYTSGAFLFLNIGGLNPYHAYGVPYNNTSIVFIVRAYKTNADGSQIGVLRSTTFTGYYVSSSRLHVPVGSGITKYTLSYYINGVEVNSSEPVFYNNLPSYLSTNFSGIDTSTPANIYNSLTTKMDADKGQYTFNTSGNQLSSRLLTRVSALNNYQSSGQDIKSDGVQTLKSITIGDTNVFGVYSETTSISNPQTATTVSYKLTKVDSAGNQILSDVNNPATFDTIIATVPKPSNGMITINRIINNTTTPNVASININTNAKTTTWAGQEINVITITSNTVTISYKGPFSEIVVETGATESQDIAFDEESLPCLPTGTRVLTPTGYCTVETLQTGDKIVTSSGKTVTAKVYSRYIPFATEASAPYLIPAGTFGKTQKTAIRLSPLHAINISKNLWHIPKYAAMHYSSIKQYGIGEEITYYHIETPDFFRDNLVIEDNIVVESFANKQCAGIQYIYVFDKKRNAFVRASAPKSGTKLTISSSPNKAPAHL